MIIPYDKAEKIKMVLSTKNSIPTDFKGWAGQVGIKWPMTRNLQFFFLITKENTRTEFSVQWLLHDFLQTKKNMIFWYLSIHSPYTYCCLLSAISVILALRKIIISTYWWSSVFSVFNIYYKCELIFEAGMSTDINGEYFFPYIRWHEEGTSITNFRSFKWNGG